MSLRHRTSRTALILAVGSALAVACGGLVTTSWAQAGASGNSTKKAGPLSAAKAQLAHGDLHSAEASVWSVLGENPNQEEALTLLGTIRERQQRYAEAAALFRRVLQLSPNSETAHRGLGGALVAENKPDEAIEQYNAAIELAPKDLELKVDVARLYSGRGQFREALSVLRTIPPGRFPVEAIPVKAASLLAVGQAEEVFPLIEQAKGSSPAEFELAEVFLSGKLPDASLRCLDLAVADLKKRPARFYYLQGRARQAKGEAEAALASLNEAIALDPKSVDTLVAIAEAHGDRNQHAKAVSLLQKALTVSPGNAVVLRHLVVEATKAGNGQAAVDAASTLSAETPANPDDLYLAGAALLQQNSSGASAVLEKYVTLRPENSKAWLGLGMAYVQQHKYAEAREPLEHALRLDPNISEAEYQLGVVAKNNGKSEEAIQHFERAVKLQPRHAKALWNLGNLYLQAGELQKAQEKLQAAESIDSNNLETEYDLALVLSRLGKPELAKEHFERFRRMKEAQPPAQRDAR